ncbi:DoxX family protein [Rhodococcus sp. USK13]|uniref:DoxX family protein n=1 Tax=Rhodococcus sp. USK13 TaxID=2806442 RepID=UPI001BD1A342|nr:DoxX family protein [Rhodococcus sp. USK13]
MPTAHTVLSFVLAALIALIGTLKVVQHPKMLDNAHHLGYSARAFLLIGLLEWAAAVGLSAGVFFTPLGIAAATGLVALMIGGALAHLRAKDSVVATAPAAVFGALAVGVIVTAVAA